MRQCESIANNFTPDMGLYFVLVGDEEMLLIGREADVRERLQYGTGNILAEHHQTTGKWLNDLYELRDANWLTSIDSLYHAALDVYRCRKNQKTSIDESIAAAEEQRVWQEFLKDKIASGHPVNQYIALRIWNGYKNVRDASTRKCLDDFRMKARNLVRPLCGINEIEMERGLHISEKTALWDWGTPILEEDRVNHIVTSDNGTEYVCATWSLMPIRSYYLAKFAKQHRCLVKCKLCGKGFFSPNLTFDLCSDACRTIARTASISNRVGSLAHQVDMLSRREYQHWMNRINMASKSGRWSESDLARLKLEMKQFQQRKNPKNEECRKGCISFNELTDWYMREREYLRELMSQ